MKLSIFILAAGLGERLRPITDYIPKPLIPILGKPALQSVLEKVSTLPVYKIGINLHHKRDVIERWINQSAFSRNIELFHEEPIMGTGGALYNAGAFMKNSTFLVHNSDIISDIDLKQLIAFHLSSKNLATIAVHDHPEFNKLEIDEKGFLKDVGTGSGKSSKYLAFTGIAVYQPEFLKFLPAGASGVVDTWLKVIHEGYKIGSLDVSGCYWTDIGTPDSYAKAVINELRMNGEMVYIHHSANWCKDIDLDGYVVIEGGNTNFTLAPSLIDKALAEGRSVSLKNCIVLPGAETEIENQYNFPPSPSFGKGGTEEWLFENCILGPGFKINISESDLFDSTDNNNFLIGTGGSDRKYYRVKKDTSSSVLMQCPDDDPGFQRHIEYTLFFQKHSVPVPELIDVKSGSKSAIFEDVGDLSLYNWLKCRRDNEQAEKIYRKVIDVLTLIHTISEEHISDCPLLRQRIFDYEHLRWETSYFVERFLEEIDNIRVKNLPALHDEFHRLALQVDSFHKTVVHRDFQSQNIMITKRGIPRIVDYQGAKIGPPAYDVVSVLWDPYYRLEDNSRERILDYYIGEMKKKIQWFKEDKFRETLLPCRLQRHMQALGAYGFLSSVKGKRYFMKYIPEGLRLLREDMTAAKNTYPVLFNLIKEL